MNSCRDLPSHEDESWVFNFFWDLKTSIHVELLCHLVYQQQQPLPGSFVLHVMHRLKVTSIHVLQTLSIYLPLAHCLKMGSESWHVGLCPHSIESNNNTISTVVFKWIFKKWPYLCLIIIMQIVGFTIYARGRPYLHFLWFGSRV